MDQRVNAEMRLLYNHTHNQFGTPPRHTTESLPTHTHSLKHTAHAPALQHVDDHSTTTILRAGVPGRSTAQHSTSTCASKHPKCPCFDEHVLHRSRATDMRAMLKQYPRLCKLSGCNDVDKMLPASASPQHHQVPRPCIQAKQRLINHRCRCNTA